MIPLKPSLLVQTTAVPLSHVQAASLERRPTSRAHTSLFRSLFLDMHVYSPSVKVVKEPGMGSSRPLPVFGDQDKIEGKVVLGPSCSQNGRLTISLEGVFEYLYVNDNPDDGYPRHPTVKKHRQVFLSSSASIPILSIPDGRSTIREALTVRKRPSTSNLHSVAYRSCEFSFELPRGSRFGEEMPSTFLSKTHAGKPQRQQHSEEFKVAYRIMVAWEPSDGSEKPAMLEAPVLFQPDTDFQSFDGSTKDPDSWLEMALIPERPIPFNCAVTLPRPQSFSRYSFVPYYVVFATSTRSPCLIKEIAADATIAVSLVRKITITPQRALQSLTLPDTPPASDESDGSTSTPPFASRARLLKRPIRSLSRPTRDGSSSLDKTRPEVSQEAFSVLRTLQTQVFIGFPKRPRVVEPSQYLPDGLYKGKVQLSKDMIPSVDWPGVSIKYYLDVSVLFGLDSVRARVPIKVF